MYSGFLSSSLKTTLVNNAVITVRLNCRVIILHESHTVICCYIITADLTLQTGGVMTANYNVKEITDF